MTFRIGVLGAATITPFALMSPARHVEGVQIAAVAARDKVRAQKFAAKHGVAKVHDSYDALLADPAIDAIYNPLPNSHHSKWTIAALNAGKHVLCEKPLAANADDARAMADAQKRTGKVLQEAFHWRHHTLAKRLVDVIASGTIGDVTRIETNMCIPLPFPNDIRYRLDLAGGALMDTGCYAIHMLRTCALAGRLGEPTITRADLKLASPGVDRAARAEVSFASGATGSFRCSLWSLAVFDISLRVTGTRGSIKVFNPVGPMVIHRFTLVSDGKKTSEQFDKTGTYTYQLRAFHASCTQGAPVLTTADDGVLNQQVLDATYLQAGLEVRKPAA